MVFQVFSFYPAVEGFTNVFLCFKNVQLFNTVQAGERVVWVALSSEDGNILDVLLTVLLKVS